MTKKEALAKDLEIVEEDLEETGPDTFEDVNTGYEYWVLTDDEADEEFYDREKSIIDELKDEGFSDPYWIINNIDRNAFDDVVREFNEYYVNDLDKEDLIEEAINYDLITEDEAEDLDEDRLQDLRDDLIDELSDVEDSVDWYIDNYGEKDAIETAFAVDAIDYDSLIKDIEFNDGRGPALAGYDGVENWIYGTDYYYYRQN